MLRNRWSLGLVVMALLAGGGVAGCLGRKTHFDNTLQTNELWKRNP